MREFKGNWTDLFFGFRIALDLRKMFLGLLGLIFSFAGLALIFFFGALPKEPSLLASIKAKQFNRAFFLLLDWVEKNYQEPFLRFLDNPSQVHLFPNTADAGASVWGLLVLAGAFLWLIFIWSKFGGAISRITAVEIAKDERITVHEALEFSKKKFTSYFWSTVAVALAFFFFFLCNLLGGLVGAIPYAGPILAAILSIFAFLGGFIMMLIGIGGFFGWPLMSPAVAAEGTDAFDAVSRAFSYIFTRPWQYLWYWLVTCVYGAFSVAFVWLFTLIMVKLSIGSAHVGMGERLNPVIDALFRIGPDKGFFSEMTVPQAILAVVLGTIIMVLYGLAFSYLLSFFYTARSLMYFILRHQVDSTDMTEVYLEDEEDDEFFTDDLAETPAADAGTDKPATEEGDPPAEEKPAEEGEAPPAEEPEAAPPAEEAPAEEPPSEEPPSDEAPPPEEEKKEDA